MHGRLDLPCHNTIEVLSIMFAQPVLEDFSCNWDEWWFDMQVCEGYVSIIDDDKIYEICISCKSDIKVYEKDVLCIDDKEVHEILFLCTKQKETCKTDILCSTNDILIMR